MTRFGFANTLRDAVITVGALLSCVAFVALAIGLAHLGGYGRLSFAVISLAIAAAIFIGSAAAYTLARVLLAAVALVIFFGIGINYFAYEDAQFNHIPYWYILCGVIVSETVLVFLFYSLGEHAKLRKSHTRI